VIYAVDTEAHVYYLLFIYAKTEMADVTPEEIEALLSEL